MTATQRYELIRPIIHKEKTIQQVHKENDISIRTLGRYLKRFREGEGQIESLADKSSAAHNVFAPRKPPNSFVRRNRRTFLKD